MTEDQLDRIDYFAMETTQDPAALQQIMLQDTKLSSVPGLRVLGNRLRAVRRWIERDYKDDPWTLSIGNHFNIPEARRAYFARHGHMHPISAKLANSINTVCLIFPDMQKVLAFEIGLRLYYHEVTNTKSEAILDYLTLHPWKSIDDQYIYREAVFDGKVTPFAYWDMNLLDIMVGGNGNGPQSQPFFDLASSIKEGYNKGLIKQSKPRQIQYKLIHSGYRLPFDPKVHLEQSMISRG